MLDTLFPEKIEWEGLEGVDAADAWINPSGATTGGLNAMYLVRREGSLATTLGTLAVIDEFTPDYLKGEAYYAALGTVFLASARPFDPIYVPKKFSRLVDAIVEDPKQLRRTVKESQFVGTLANREEIKQAFRFLCDKKIMEPLGGGEFHIVRRPIRKLSIS